MKKAFTLYEIIIVIVVIGILAVVIIPRLGKNRVHKAAVQLLSHIRYTQHLAMQNDKFDPKDAIWYKRRWQIFFSDSSDKEGSTTVHSWAYTIFADDFTCTGKPDPSEIAVNPLDPTKKLTGGYTSGGAGIEYKDSRATKSMNLGYTYDIEDIKFEGCGPAKRVTFDELGRPFYGDSSSATDPYSRISNQECIITLCLTECESAGNEEKISIHIKPRTGYTYISY